MKRNLIIFAVCLMTSAASAQQPPLVYDQEHTGIHFAVPQMPGYDQLPECRELPDPLAWSNGKGKVTQFKDWEQRRSEIAAQDRKGSLCLDDRYQHAQSAQALV